MSHCPTHYKFPEGSLNRDYFVFEKLPDGSALWRDWVLGMENVELKLQELARESNHKFFALNLLDRSVPIIRPLQIDLWSKSKSSDLEGRLLG
jgi:hypothetical protein